MKLRLKSAVAGAAALALAGTGLALASPANAYTGTGAGGAPSWVAGDTARKGSVLFYDAAGNQIIGGANVNNVGANTFLAASGGALGAGANKVTGKIALPDPTNAFVDTWTTGNITPINFTFTGTGAPTGLPSSVTSNVAYLRQNAAGSAWLDVASAGQLYPTKAGQVVTPANDANYLNILEVRLYDNVDASNYWATDIEFNPLTATGTYDGLQPGEWKVVWPTVSRTLTNTTTTVATSPASPTTATPMTYTATVAPAAATGKVQFSVDSVAVGSPVAVSGGVATYVDGTRTAGGHTVSAVFTADAYNVVGYNNSNGSANFTVGVVQQSTTTAVSGPATATVGSPTTYTASVTAGASQATGGTVTFSINGVPQAPIAYAGAAVSLVFTPAAADVTNPSATPPVPAVAITASYTGNAAYGNSPGNTINVTVTAPAYPQDPQNVTVVVPQGTLIISTPYTVANPLSLGTMQLNAQGTQYTASAAFGDPNAQATADPGQITGSENPPALVARKSNGVTITDTRANGPGWVASVAANNFSDGGGHTISGNNLTFTAITPKYLPGNAIQGGVAVPAGNTVTGFGGTSKTFASLAPQAPANTSTGTVAITAVLGLVAPTSTVAGTYTATITFSIV